MGQRTGTVRFCGTTKFAPGMCNAVCMLSDQYGILLTCEHMNGNPFFPLTPSKRILNLNWFVSKFFITLSSLPPSLCPPYVSLSILLILMQLSGKNNDLKSDFYLSTIMT